MDDKTLHTLEYPKILERLAEYAAFSASAELARALRPTVDQRPATGDIAVGDNFSDPATRQTFETTGGTARISKDALTLAAPEMFASLVSLRRGVVPDDFYLEISASTSLCRGKDTYGVIFRSDGGTSHYRLIVSCEGQLRVERWRPAEAAVVQDWTPSGQVPPAGPHELRLGIWMAGSDMRIFVNGVFQFQARDPLLIGQQVGVFLRSTGANATSVTFSNLVIRRLQGYVPSPVPSPTSDWTKTPTRAPTATGRP